MKKTECETYIERDIERKKGTETDRPRQSRSERGIETKRNDQRELSRVREGERQ